MSTVISRAPVKTPDRVCPEVQDAAPQPQPQDPFSAEGPPFELPLCSLCLYVTFLPCMPQEAACGPACLLRAARTSTLWASQLHPSWQSVWFPSLTERAQVFGLEDLLQGRGIDHGQLPEEGPKDRVQEHAVPEKANLKYQLGLRG